MKSSQAGFTILEILVLVVALAVVGIIAYPKYRTMLYQSREGRTKASLGELRGALAIYYSDHFGIYPSDEGDPQTRLVRFLVPHYIKKVPSVDLTHYHPKLNTIQDRFNHKGDWFYVFLDGFIGVNCGHPDTKGEAISNW